LHVAEQLKHSQQHAQQNINQAQDKQSENFAVRNRSQAKFVQSIKDLAPGSLVLMRKPGDKTVSLEFQWEGPYTFLGFTNEQRNQAVLKDRSGKEWTRKITQIKPFVNPQ
jgi:hypothetical protein